MANHTIINWIKAEASDTILSRGKSYRDNVSRLKYVADEKKWTAVVRGTERYEVEIEDLGRSDYYGECDCPYDQEDICKHIVAVAYEIAELKQDSFAAKTSQVPENVFPDISAFDFYEKIFLQTSIASQSAFLKLLFTQNEAIRTQFSNFVSEELFSNDSSTVAKALFSSQKINISKLSAEIYEGIMEIDFDGEEYYENSDDYGGYDDYGEGLENWAIEQLEDFLTVYIKQINSFLEKQDLFSALSVLIAIHEAAKKLPPDADGGDYEVFSNDDFPTAVLDIIKEQYKEISKVIQNSILNFSNRWELTKLLLEMKSPSHFEYSENILMTLCREKETATRVLRYFEDENLMIKETAELALHCGQFTEKADEWLRLAILLYEKKDTVAIKLLAYYDKVANEKAYHTIARTAIDALPYYKMNLVEIIKDKLKYEIDPSFFLSTLVYYSEKTNDLTSYIKVSTYWDLKEKEVFIQNQIRKSDFYAQILKHEERYEELLKYIENKVADFYGVYDLLQYIGQKYPEEAFILFKQRFFADEDRMGMNRKGYHEYCSKLEYLKEIEVTKEEKQILINRLRSIYASRSAFLDELRQAAKSVGLH
jgi:hypothetical protein